MDESTLRSMVGSLFGWDHPDFEDAMQEARICVWLQTPEYDPAHGKSLKSFLFQRVRWRLLKCRDRWHLPPDLLPLLLTIDDSPALNARPRRYGTSRARIRHIAWNLPDGRAKSFWRWCLGEGPILTGWERTKAVAEWRQLLAVSHHRGRPKRNH